MAATIKPETNGLDLVTFRYISSHLCLRIGRFQSVCQGQA